MITSSGGLGSCANEFCENRENGTSGADASAPKSDLHFLGGAYHFSALMCPPPNAIQIHQEKQISVYNVFRWRLGWASSLNLEF